MPATLVQREFTIQNKQGLHARPAAMLVKLCNNFQADIWVEKDEEQVNGKSIMGLMMLAANHGSKIKVTADGPDAEAAIDKIGELISGGFGGVE
ncbi:MAG: HPr family phosphocarrier protein [Verrucomicrobiales bacterium]